MWVVIKSVIVQFSQLVILKVVICMYMVMHCLNDELSVTLVLFAQSIKLSVCTLIESYAYTGDLCQFGC